MIIQTLVDNPDSWIIPYAKKLNTKLSDAGHSTELLHATSKIEEGDVLVLLGCEDILPEEKLQFNQHNLIVHESALPEGKGWSPLTWQVLEGKNEIPITLFEAKPDVDSGPIYKQKIMEFEGHELVDELREKQGQYTIDLVLEFVEEYPNVEATPQTGKATYYPRRTPKDSELDVHQTLADQFNLLRVVDNERYPAFFNYKGHKYKISIEKIDHS